MQSVDVLMSPPIQLHSNEVIDNDESMTHSTDRTYLRWKRQKLLSGALMRRAMVTYIDWSNDETM